MSFNVPHAPRREDVEPVVQLRRVSVRREVPRPTARRAPRPAPPPVPRADTPLGESDVVERGIDRDDDTVQVQDVTGSLSSSDLALAGTPSPPAEVTGTDPCLEPPQLSDVYDGGSERPSAPGLVQEGWSVAGDVETSASTTAATPLAHRTSSEWRRRKAKRCWAFKVGEVDEPPPYDEYEEVVPIPACPSLGAEGGPPPGVFRELKPPNINRLVPQRLYNFLEEEGHHELAEDFRALQNLDLFEKRFVNKEACEQLPPPPVRSVRLAPYLFQPLIDTGSVVALGPNPTPVPITCPIRAIPDRADPMLGRPIWPMMATNARMVKPRPTPTPLLPVLVEAVLKKKFVVYDDFVGWFFSATVAMAVAQRWFGCRSEGEWYACVAGLLGWVHMPSMMAALAQVISCAAVRRAKGRKGCTKMVPPWLRRAVDPTGRRRPPDHFEYWVDDDGNGVWVPVWIDNLFFLGDDEVFLLAVVQEFLSINEWLGIKSHRLQLTPTQELEAIGLHFHLGLDPRWRLRPDWVAKWIASARAVDDRASVTARTAWRLVGGAVWAVYGSMYPMVWVRPAIAFVRKIAKAWAAGRLRLDSLVGYAASARATVRAVATQLAKGEWRRLTVPVGRPIYSDGAVEGGVVSRGALVFRRGRWYSIASGPSVSATHINVVEFVAQAEGHIMADAQPGRAVPRAVDSMVVAYQLAGGNPRPANAAAVYRRTYAAAAERGEGILPMWMPSKHEPADEPSRADHSYMVRTPAALPRAAFAHARVVGTGVIPVAVIPEGWDMDVTREEFLRAVASVTVPTGPLPPPPVSTDCGRVPQTLPSSP
jgi:hypothetical protein